MTARLHTSAVTPGARAQRLYRSAHPEYRDRQALRYQAWYEAVMALVRRHPAEYQALLGAELRHLGAGPPPMEKPCPCGGTITRKAPVGRWPSSCGECA